MKFLTDPFWPIFFSIPPFPGVIAIRENQSVLRGRSPHLPHFVVAVRAGWPPKETYLFHTKGLHTGACHPVFWRPYAQ